EQHRGARRDGGAEGVGGEFEAVGLGRFDDDGLGAGEFHQFGIADPVGGGDDDFIAGVAQGGENVVQRVLGAVGDDHLVGGVFQLVALGVGVGDGFLELGDAAGDGVVGVAGPHRGGGRLANVVGGGEI